MVKQPFLRYAPLTLLVLSLAAGCASLAQHRERTAIGQVMQEWKAAFLANDSEGLLRLYSDNFRFEDRDKAAMKDYMAVAMKELNADDGKVIVEYATIDIQGDKALVMPISLSARRGSNTIGLELSKESGRWLVVGMQNK